MMAAVVVIVVVGVERKKNLCSCVTLNGRSPICVINNTNTEISKLREKVYLAISQCVVAASVRRNNIVVVQLHH